MSATMEGSYGDSRTEDKCQSDGQSYSSEEEEGGRRPLCDSRGLHLKLSSKGGDREDGSGQHGSPPPTPPRSTPTTPPRPSSPYSLSKGSSDASPGGADKDKVCGGILTPPREERSAPEGTSSPTPRPSEASDKGAQAPPAGYLSQAQVDALLKRQEAQFEERLQRVSHSTDQKEKELHTKMKEEQKELAELRSVVVEVTQSREALLKMLEQYKDMLAAVVKGKSSLDKDQEQRVKEIEAQKNQALEDLANVEAAFSDVHRKYERTKQIVDTMRRNEETLQGAVADYDNKVKRQEATLVTFQKHAEEKMQLAGEEYDKLKQNTDQELTKMGALLKKAEMKIISLQDQLERKSRDNQELTQLLDDLIAKMGPTT